MNGFHDIELGEARPAEAQPAEAQPAEAQPAEAQPAGPTQPAVRPADTQLALNVRVSGILSFNKQHPNSTYGLQADASRVSISAPMTSSFFFDHDDPNDAEDSDDPDDPGPSQDPALPQAASGSAASDPAAYDSSRPDKRLLHPRTLCCPGQSIERNASGCAQLAEFNTNNSESRVIGLLSNGFNCRPAPRASGCAQLTASN
ncbi:hypothetical protein B0T25DRAFT_563289 [Lasiosphaeria hispida]|uniref:Uncharacterized protein n=1 Tax=Lasiosphaeria hispida TaxID=260671 RepID=A0AAJ0MKX3_9PEZI|nr:hypothetical protein B0T25DRAFT_563289 [Lasiosphaeria hispida]